MTRTNAASINTTLKALTAIADEIVKPGADVASLFNEAVDIRAEYRKAVEQEYASTYSKARAVATVKETGIAVRGGATTAKVKTLTDLLAARHIKDIINESLPWGIITKAETARADDARLVEGAEAALRDWSLHRDRDVLRGSSTFREHALDYLKEIADLVDLAAEGENVLKSLCDYILQRTIFGNDDRFGSIDSLRLSEIERHLARQEAAKYALSCLLGAVYGRRGARIFGVSLNIYYGV